jgi:uncharacterized protein YbaP (TraB family)
MDKLSARGCAIVLTLGAVLALQVQAQSEGPVPKQISLEELEAVLVIGEQPGPGLWKVSKDGHVLWLLGTYGPLPNKMSWRSRQVEAIVKESQEIYGQAGLMVSASDGKLVYKATGNVGGKVLADVLPNDLYRRFTELNHEFGGSRDKFERLRPTAAVDGLRDQALQKLKLTSDGGVENSLQRLARKHRVKFRSLMVKADDKPAREITKQLDAIPREQDIPCAKGKMDQLESTLKVAIERANAWARGDVATLRRRLGVTDEGPEACAAFFASMKGFKDGGFAAYAQGEATLREALRNNRSTLAMMSIGELLRPDGILARFRADGYEVEEP